MSKKQKITVGVAFVLLVAVIAALLIWQPWKLDTQSGSKAITVSIVHNDTTDDIVIHTDAEYLADALLEKGIISERRDDGFYTTIHGITADYSKDNSWWCVTKNGEMTSVGMNEQPIEDNEHYEITYTIN